MRGRGKQIFSMPWSDKDAVLHATLYGNACLPASFCFSKVAAAIKKDEDTMFQALMNTCYTGNAVLAKILIDIGVVPHPYHFTKAWTMGHLRLSALLAPNVHGYIPVPYAHPFKTVIECKLALRRATRAVRVIERNWMHALVCPYTKVGKHRLKKAVIKWIEEDATMLMHTVRRC